MVAITVITMLFQAWTHSLQKKKGKRQFTPQIRTFIDTKIESLEDRLKDEKKERKMLQRSSELLLECVKGLQKKLDSEVICRKNFERKQMKVSEEYKQKAERLVLETLQHVLNPFFSCEEKLNSLKNSYIKAIKSMESDLQKNAKFHSLRAAGSSGDVLKAF